MSLEGDLLLPPRGPAKWGWTQRMMTKIAQARGVVSPDASLVVNPTTGGIALRGTGTAATDDTPYASKFQVDAVLGGVTVAAGTVRFNGSSGSRLTVASTTLFASTGIVALKLSMYLTAPGLALTPRHWSRLDWNVEVALSTTPELVVVSTTDLYNNTFLCPNTVKTSAYVYIPLALLTRGSVTQWWVHQNGINLNVYHDHWTVSRE